MTLIGAMTPHFFVLNFIMFLVASFWFYFYVRNVPKSYISEHPKNSLSTQSFFDKTEKKDLIKYLKILSIFVVLLVLLNMYWMQGMFAGGMLSEINEKHEDFFAPKMSSGVSAIAKVIGMWGFWREGAYDRVYSLMPLWLWYGIIALLILLLLVGYYSDLDNSNSPARNSAKVNTNSRMLCNENKKSKFFYTLFWLGLILGVGISHPYTGKIFEVLFANVPFFNGFRDSHKFVALIALAYAYFLPNATEAINKNLMKLKVKLGKILSIVVIIGLIALIFGLNFAMINLHGQVKNVEYPRSYQEVNEFFNSREIDGKIVYLPWQGYLSYNWSRDVSSDGRIGAFANGIIDKGVISGPDEYGGNSGFRAEVSNCLNNNDKKCLKEIGVEYVMHDKCAFYPDNYSWLNDFENAFSNECLNVYYVGGVSEKAQIPARFILGLIISILALIYIIFVLGSGRLYKRP